MHLFGGLTPSVIDSMSTRDFLGLCDWVDQYEKASREA